MPSFHLKNYAFPLILTSAIILGGVTGSYFPQSSLYLKPFGEIFLHLIFTAIVPLVFFSVSAAIVRAGSLGNLGKMMVYTTLVFIATGIIAALYALLLVKIFPPADNIVLALTAQNPGSSPGFLNQIANIFSVPDFSKLFSHTSMLPLITFSVLVGLAVSAVKEKGQVFFDCLQSGEAVFMQVFALIMYYAPPGFFAYFAVLVQEMGTQLLGNYLRIALLYSLAALAYFIILYSVYAWIAGRKEALFLFWKNIFLPASTAIATCSSAASIPANLAASTAMKVPREIAETVIPLGSLLHKDGSVIGGIFKIAFLFGIFHVDFSGFFVLVTALGVSLLVGSVMGAIPGGGMLGELLILSLYGFPTSVLVAVAAISIVIDPLATLLNVTGNTVSSMLIARCVVGKDWLRD